jgi:hypothetical protein
VAIAVLGLAGCIDEFHGSNVQVDFAPAMPVQAAGELPDDVHFTLYAFDDATDADGNPVGHLFELQRFEIHRIVDLGSPCFIDVGPNVPVEGLHVSQYAAKIEELEGIADITNPPPGKTEEQLTAVATAIQRQQNVTALAGSQGLEVVSSASSASYPAVAADCASAGIPPADCTDDASNARRLQLCTSAWHDDPALFEGTDRVLTSPLNGTTFGMVDGTNPVNFAPVGGAQWFVDESLDSFDGFAIYVQPDTAAASEPGDLLLFGRPEGPITRGVIRVPMTSASSPGVTASLAIFANLDDDEVHF